MSAAVIVAARRRIIRSARLAPLLAVLALTGCAANNYGGPINGQQALSPEERRLQAVETKLAEVSRRQTTVDAGRDQKVSEDLGKLRGLIEQLRYDFDQSERRQQEAITSFDARIKALEAHAIGTADGSIGGVSGDPAAQQFGGTVAPPSNVPLSTAADEEALYLKSFDQLKAGKYDEATAGFKAMLVKYPQGNYSDNAWYWSGESYYIKKDYPNALTSYRSLLEKFPASPKVPDALLKTGIIQQDQKKADQAKAAYNRVIKEFPNSSAAPQARTRLSQLH
ncbi:tol-pal system protein YbgF [uncultured Nevskia sp.]|uniref:tol-pal system protein YbgF n=1 Tax=uncultured Nevskia sp. TaxID=228950 RepID=UPI0025D01FC3|nr:tol-pal system protein YbgF [uncultured Nevskia sp.]